MAYTLTYSGGTITVNDGTLNTTSTSLSLPGRNYAGYGSPVDQNLVSLVENFAFYTSSPPNAVRGQIWFDTTTNQLKFNISPTFGTPDWKAVSTLAGDATFDDVTVAGDLDVAGDITCTGTITANIIQALSHVITGVSASVSAAGTNQATATLLTTDINVVTNSTSPSALGVRLPATAGGHRITVMNYSGNAINVYPTGGTSQVNALGGAAPYALAIGGRLDFVSISATQWYTLNATFG